MLCLDHAHQRRDLRVDLRGNLLTEFDQERGIPGSTDFDFIHFNLLPFHNQRSWLKFAPNVVIPRYADAITTIMPQIRSHVGCL